MMGRFYLFSHRLWTRLLRVLNIGFTGFWLGVLSRRQLHAVDDLMYQRSDTYRSQEHNLRGLFPWEATALETYFQDCRRVMILGAGGGREVLVLAQRGLEVVGYECNPALANFAGEFLKQQHSSGRVEYLPRDAAPPPGELYDGIIVGWAAYMLMAGRTNRVRWLRELREHVPEEAPILLSFFTRTETHSQYRSIVWLANVLRRVMFRHRAEVGDDLAPNYVHRFTEAEVQLELAEAGFNLVQYRSQLPDPYEPGYAIGRKQKDGSPVGAPSS